VLAPRSAATGGYIAGLRASFPVVSVAWPVVALAWAASEDAILHTLASELALLSGVVLVPLVGRALARVFNQGPLLESVATTVGVVLACGAWFLVLHGA
jgi:hypothetical protein